MTVVTGILISLIVLAALVGGSSMLYRRWRRGLAVPGIDVGALAGRLTGERLRDLTVPWRVVLEVPRGRLSGVDNVIIGPPGIIAFISTTLTRPAVDQAPSAQLTATAAVTRGAIDELVGRVGQSCDLLVNVHWGGTDRTRPLVDELAHRHVAVDGPRLLEFIETLGEARLVSSQIDQLWQAVATGIGRSDPLM
jgi:hypothetical protein